MISVTDKGQDEWLRAKLIAITGRIVSVDEMRQALELKPSTYYLQQREGRLLSAENLRTAAKNLGISPVQLMVECGVISEDDLNSYQQRQGWRRPPPL